VQEPFEFGAQLIKPGTRQTVNLPLSLLSDHTPMTIPVHVVHGREKGSRLFLSAAIHGDELNGVEIIRRLLKSPRSNCERIRIYREFPLFAGSPRFE
jgi:hypothetical protein